MKVKIIYEDNHLLVVEKPVNIAVQEDSSKDLDLLNYLKEDIKIRYNKPGNVFLALVHRLDRPVGGVMVYAKTSKAASRLSDAFRKHDVKRTYLAIVQGEISQKQGTLTHYLYKDRSKNQVYAVDATHANGKKAILHYEVLASQSQLSLVRVHLETGRSHQIRVQFKTFGYPLYGDQKYGDERTIPHTQIALWAYQLSFNHPTQKEMTDFYSLPSLNQEPWSYFKMLKGFIK